MGDVVERPKSEVVGEELKQIRRKLILDYLSDPDNEWLNRTGIAQLLGVSRQRMYEIFTPVELVKIEADARLVRRRGYMKDLVEVDKKMLLKAKGGDTKAAKLVYEQLDEPVDQVVGDAPVLIQVNINRE